MIRPDSEAQTVEPSTHAHQIFTKTVHSPRNRENARHPILLPQSIMITITPPTPTPSFIPPRPSNTQDWVKIELSNYPPQLTHQDILALFQDFTISPDFILPNAKNLAYPLRTFIKMAGEQEAERAVQELCWSKLGGRQINVRIVEKTGHEEKAVAVADVADNMKIGILSE
jgi:hypothetical protein